ncbi:MAG: hypothetical protein PVG70_00675 [Desulfobacterales bacterium]
MSQLTFNDRIGSTLHGLGDIGEQPCFLSFIEQVEQCMSLAVIVIASSVIVPICIATDF